MNREQAIEYAKDHLDEIPVTDLQYLYDSDEPDEERCEFERPYQEEERIKEEREEEQEEQGMQI